MRPFCRLPQAEATQKVRPTCWMEAKGAPTALATSQRVQPGGRENKAFATVTLFHLDK